MRVPSRSLLSSKCILFVRGEKKKNEKSHAVSASSVNLSPCRNLNKNKRLFLGREGYVPFLPFVYSLLFIVTLCIYRQKLTEFVKQFMKGAQI